MTLNQKFEVRIRNLGLVEQIIPQARYESTKGANQSGWYSDEKASESSIRVISEPLPREVTP